MRKGLYIIVLGLMVLFISTAFRSAGRKAYVEGELLVKFSDRVTAQTAARLLAANGGEVVDYFRQIDVYHVRLGGKSSVEETLQALRAQREVEFAEPNYLYHIDVVPNDPHFSRLWGMENTGQTGGLADADIDASVAWEVSTGSREVVVGVIDTGIDYTHPDLADNIYTNPGEDPWANPFDPSTGNGIDDDGNGKVDDWKGWNFYAKTNDPFDDNMHGTHCAGTIGAIGNNGIGVAGVCWQVRLMPLKFLDSRGSGATSDAVSAILYAADMGVKILNNSWGGGSQSTSMENAIRYAANKGVLFVAAAGNEGNDNDLIPNYPSSYDLPNILAVAATDHSDNLAVWGDGGGGNDDDCGLICATVNAGVPGSNWGYKSVHLAAPGKNILSTVPGESYSSLSGTSMAAPHVAGAAALLLAINPSLNVQELRSILTSTVDPLESLANKVASGGRLNLAAAVAAAAPKL